MTYWRELGEYVNGKCPNCQRERLLETTDNKDNKRIICKKCNWEPAANNYCNQR